MSLAGDPKFTEEQKYEIAVEFVSGMLSHSEICRKWDISPTYAYKLKDRALDLLRQGMGRPTGKPDAQALAIHTLKKHETVEGCVRVASINGSEYRASGDCLLRASFECRSLCA